MSSKLSLCAIAGATATALSVNLPAHAVHLGSDGYGQALIYPYYTVRSAAGNAFNTYLSIVNTTTLGKAVRVRVREGRAARPVLDFNLYLGPNDVWTAAMVPTEAGTDVLTVDTSCTDPAFIPTGVTPQFSSQLFRMPLHANAYTGSAADGFGDTLDRTREGYVEMIEMGAFANPVDPLARAIMHTSAGTPVNCAAIRAATSVPAAAPRGGLSGTLTLINVASGLDFALDATALDGLASRPFFRPPSDPYPDFAAAEIDPVSTVLAHGQLYRSVWARPQDAVSAVLMRRSWMGEFILDNPTRSLTDFVAALPTRHMYVTASAFEPPFTAPAKPGAPGEPLRRFFFNREEQGGPVLTSDFPEPPPGPGNTLHASAAVVAIRNTATHMPPDTTRSIVLGSTTLGMGAPIFIGTGAQNGWIEFQLASPETSALRSLPGSTRTNLATGEVTTGPHAYFGLPLVGFSVRTFSNGTLACAGAGSCQGNYGGAFSFKYRPAVQPP